MPRGMSDLDRVMALVTKHKDGHWMWKGSRCGRRRQYGQVRLRGKKTVAHKAVWLLLVGEIPSGFELLHQCGRSLCVNPEHLKIGTHLENMREASMDIQDKVQRGETHHNSKLFDQEVIDIISRAESGESKTSLAKEYGISQPYVSMLCQRLWRKKPAKKRSDKYP